MVFHMFTDFFKIAQNAHFRLALAASPKCNITISPFPKDCVSSEQPGHQCSVKSIWWSATPVGGLYVKIALQ